MLPFTGFDLWRLLILAALLLLAGRALRDVADRRHAKGMPTTSA